MAVKLLRSPVIVKANLLRTKLKANAFLKPMNESMVQHGNLNLEVPVEFYESIKALIDKLRKHRNVQEIQRVHPKKMKQKRIRPFSPWAWEIWDQILIPAIYFQKKSS